VFIRRAEDDHGLHLLLLALESESHMTFMQNVSVVPLTINARQQHDTSTSSPHLLTSPTTCNPPLEYVFSLSHSAPPKIVAHYELQLRWPHDRGSDIDDDDDPCVHANSDSQGEPSNENVPSSSPRMLPELSQEGMSENYPERDIVKDILDTPEDPMTSEEEMSSSFTLPLSQSHEPYQDSGNVLDSVSAELAPEPELVPAPVPVPELSSTITSAPAIPTSVPAASHEVRGSMEVVSVVEAVSINIAADHDAPDLTYRVVEFAAASLHSSRAPSPLQELIDPPPQTLFEPPDPQPEVSPDVQELLPGPASPSLPQSDPPASEDQITVDICIPDASPYLTQQPPKVKERKKPGHSIALSNDLRTRKRQRRTSEVENIDAFSFPESSKQGSSDAADTSIRKRRVMKRSRQSLSASSEADEASTNKLVSAPLKAVQQRGRSAPSVSDVPVAELPSRLDASGSRNDPCENIDMPALLVDALVFGRLSFLSAPDLAKNLLRDHPYLLERLDDVAAWVAIVRSVLETQSFFGRIPRRGLDPDGKKLEDTWYYEAAKGKSTFSSRLPVNGYSFVLRFPYALSPFRSGSCTSRNPSGLCTESTPEGEDGRSDVFLRSSRHESMGHLC
jgi:hypothetical protein